MIRSAARTLLGCLLCLPLLISAVRYEVRKAMPQPRPAPVVAKARAAPPPAAAAVRAVEPAGPDAPATPAVAPAAPATRRTANEHDVQDVTQDIAVIPPLKRAPALKLKLAPDILRFEVTDFDLQGVDLARRQIARGLEKRRERRHEMDQSFEGLRDLIRHTSDPEIKRFLPVVNRLERAMQNRPQKRDAGYVEGFITDLAPLAVYLEQETGLPASVILAQIIVESGWGASNITILKNNVLGIGNCRGEDEFVAEIELRHVDRDVIVRCDADTRAYRFDSVADSVLYYAYLLLENEGNARHYGALRRYIRSNRSLARTDPRAYRNRVIALISRAYHDDPAWYEDYLRRTVDIVEETHILPQVAWSMTEIADARSAR